MNRKYAQILSILICALFSFLLLPTTSLDNYEKLKNEGAPPATQYPIMQPPSEIFHKWLVSYDNTPYSLNNPRVEPPLAGNSLSLLSHLDYIPVERDQESCGNCWVWAGTGILEIALDVNEEILDRLSVQYFNSKYNGGTGPNWAGAGGWLDDFAEFYAEEGFAIPWSNTNAAWADGSQTSEDGTSVPWQIISTTPNYPINQCDVESIQTFEQNPTTTINNIKSVLAQGRAIWFGFFLPTEADWNQFFGFWNYQSEDAVWNPDYSSGHFWDSGGGGHAALCVGYNDEDPENAYWIMVNSWGTANGRRPNGIFRLDMNMDYNCYFYYGAAYYSLYWQTLDVEFDIDNTLYNIVLESQEDDGSTTGLGTLTLDGIPYNLPDNVTKAAGSYSAEYFAADGYMFDHWETTGSISVLNTTENPVNVTVNRDGVLKAAYKELIEGELTLASIESKLLHLSQNNAYFILADPTRMTGVAAYDAVSSGIIYGLCQNDQNIGFDSNSAYVKQTGGEKGKLLISNKTVLFFGGPYPHWCVSYYESVGLTPIRFYFNESANTCNFVNASGTSIAYLPATTNFGHEDMFVIEVFQDENNNTIYVFYGFSWKGTWATGIFFHDYLLDRLGTLTNGYYIYKWTDLSGDGIPQSNEIQQNYP